MIKAEGGEGMVYEFEAAQSGNPLHSVSKRSLLLGSVNGFPTVLQKHR